MFIFLHASAEHIFVVYVSMCAHAAVLFSRSHYCILPLKLLPIATGFIYRSNTDLCWRKLHRMGYCEKRYIYIIGYLAPQAPALALRNSRHKSSFYASQKDPLTMCFLAHIVGYIWFNDKEIWCNINLILETSYLF